MVILCNMDEFYHFSENDLLTPVTPNDPRLKLDPITLVEGRKVMHMNVSHGHAI